MSHLLRSDGKVRASFRIVLAIVSSVILGQSALAQESDSQRFERLLRTPAELLARAYLGNGYTLSLLEYVRQGATLTLTREDQPVEVTTSNVEEYVAEYQRRRDVLAAVIRRRGFAQVAGRYRMEIKQPCGGMPEPADSTTAELQQEDFKVNYGLGGSASEQGTPGVVIEKTLVIGDGNPSLPFWVGSVKGDRIEGRIVDETRECRFVLRRK